jgi:hypothetical protein
VFGLIKRQKVSTSFVRSPVRTVPQMQVAHNETRRFHPNEAHGMTLMISPFRVFFTLHFALLLQLRFDGGCRKDLFLVAAHRLELLCGNEANAASRSLGNQYPGDFFHVASAYDSCVIVRSAFRDQKSHAPLRVTRAAEDFHLPCAITLHDARRTARGTQRPTALRRSILHPDRDHDFLFF